MTVMAFVAPERGLEHVNEESGGNAQAKEDGSCQVIGRVVGHSPRVQLPKVCAREKQFTAG